MLAGSLFHSLGPAQANARRPKRSRLTRARREVARRQSIGSVVMRTGEVVRQGTLVCLRRVPCAQGRVSYTQSIS